MRSAILILCLLGFGMGLSACGIKPKSLAAPSGVENDNFPRTYPAGD